MTRRPPPNSPDLERFMRRVELKMDQSFDAMLKEIGEVRRELGTTQFDVRKGNMAQERADQRLTELELQVIETRERLQLNSREGEKAAVVVARQAAEVAMATPKGVWKTKLGVITATSAAFVAVVSLFKNAPAFVRGASEILVAAYTFIVGHK